MKTENSNRHQTSLVQQALRLVKVPIIISFVLTPIRFSLELAGLPENYIFLIGLLWFTLAIAIYWGVKYYHTVYPYLLVLLSLAIFSPISRIPVFILWWIEKKWEIGTHYGLYYDGFLQAFLSHIVGGAMVQIIPGFLVGAITIAVMFHKNTNSLQIKSIENE